MIIKRIDEHIEFHKAINGHKSDVAFLESVKSHVIELKSELADWVAQKGCDCGHPACSNCYDTKEAKKLLSK